MSSCFSRCLRVPIAIRAFYESYLWILQTLLLTHPDLHPALLGATAGRQRPVESAPTTYLRSKDRHRNREATMYLPASRRGGPRVDSTGSTCKLSTASSMTGSRRGLQASLAVGTEDPLPPGMG